MSTTKFSFPKNKMHRSGWQPSSVSATSASASSIAYHNNNHHHQPRRRHHSSTSSSRFNMLRGVRERFRLLRPKRSDVPPSTTFSTATTSTTATALTSPQHHLSHQSPPGGAPAPLPLPPSNSRPPLPHPHPHHHAHPPHRSHGAIPDVAPSDAQHHQNTYNPHQAPFLAAENTPANGQTHVSASAGFKNDPLPQPRVFRNRSLEYGHRRDRQLLGLFAEKARRTFHRGKPAAMDDSMHHPQYAQHHPNHPYHYPSPQGTPHPRTPQQIQQQQQYRHQFNHQQRDDALAPMNNRRLAPSPLAQHHSSATAAPILHGYGHPTGQQQSTAPPRLRNDDSFSSLPSTHASRDPFLNDDLPIEISHVDRPYGGRMRHNMQGHDDRDAGVGGSTAFDRNAKQSHANQAHASNQNHRMFAADGLSPASPAPSSLASSITSRKRSTVWKRRYDPDAEFQSRHEREILKAVALSETAVKERAVDAAQQLALIVDEQVSELDTVLADVDRQVKATRATAQRLPSPTDIRFQQMLTSSVDNIDQMTGAIPNTTVTAMSTTITAMGNDPNSKAIPSSTVPVSSLQANRKNAIRAEDDMERTLLELDWKERVWDVDALIIEKQFEQAVNSVEVLDGDGIAHQSSELIELFQRTIRVLVDELSACCARGRVETASSTAALLGKLGMADHARSLILRVAETELLAELGYIYSNSQDVTPRTATAMVSKTIAVLRHARVVFCDIEAHSMEVTLSRKFVSQQKDEELTKKHNSNKISSSMFLAWAVVQCDRVFAEFIAPVIERVRKIDPVTILVNEQAVLGGSGADLDNDIGIGMDDLWNATSTSLLMLTKI